MTANFIVYAYTATSRVAHVPDGHVTRYCHFIGSSYSLHGDSLVPRPHPRGGKGSGELGQNPWACAEEFPRANEIVALAQSYDKLTAGMQHRYTYRVAIQFR